MNTSGVSRACSRQDAKRGEKKKRKKDTTTIAKGTRTKGEGHEGSAVPHLSKQFITWLFPHTVLSGSLLSRRPSSAMSTCSLAARRAVNIGSGGSTCRHVVYTSTQRAQARQFAYRDSRLASSVILPGDLISCCQTSRCCTRTAPFFSLLRMCLRLGGTPRPTTSPTVVFLGGYHAKYSF